MRAKCWNTLTIFLKYIAQEPETKTYWLSFPFNLSIVTGSRTLSHNDGSFEWILGVRLFISIRWENSDHTSRRVTRSEDSRIHPGLRSSMALWVASINLDWTANRDYQPYYQHQGIEMAVKQLQLQLTWKTYTSTRME